MSNSQAKKTEVITKDHIRVNVGSNIRAHNIILNIMGFETKQAWKWKIEKPENTKWLDSFFQVH